MSVSVRGYADDKLFIFVYLFLCKIRDIVIELLLLYSCYRGKPIEDASSMHGDKLILAPSPCSGTRNLTEFNFMGSN